MATWYKVYLGGMFDITPVSVVEETDSTITVEQEKILVDRNAPKEWIRVRRDKTSEYYRYFPTFKEATEYLSFQAADEVRAAKDQLSFAERRQKAIAEYIAAAAQREGK